MNVLSSGVNDTPAPPLTHEVRFLPNPNNQPKASGGLMLRPVSVPVLSKHPLGMSYVTYLEK